MTFTQRAVYNAIICGRDPYLPELRTGDAAAAILSLAAQGLVRLNVDGTCTAIGQRRQAA